QAVLVGVPQRPAEAAYLRRVLRRAVQRVDQGIAVRDAADVALDDAGEQPAALLGPLLARLLKDLFVQQVRDRQGVKSRHVRCPLVFGTRMAEDAPARADRIVPAPREGGQWRATRTETDLMAMLDHWHPVLASRELRSAPVAVKLASQPIV